MNKKRYIIIAGVNGAGKSTLYRGMLAEDEELKNTERVNADDILKSLNADWRNMGDQLKAMKVAVNRIYKFVDEGISFNHETTLAGASIKNIIQKAKQQGFEVDMYYVGLDSADLAVQRVNERVKKGGHGVPESVVRKRYEASLRNLKDVLPLCDIVKIYDNTYELNMIAGYKNGRQVCFKECEWFRKWMELDTFQTLKNGKLEKCEGRMEMSNWKDAINRQSVTGNMEQKESKAHEDI